MTPTAVVDCPVTLTTSSTPNRERLRDGHGRAITDLRVSITDRCNFRCVYCRTGNEGAQYAELAHADYLRMIRLFVALGIEKIRLTGGEPLLRSGLLELVQEISRLRTTFTPTPEPLDLALTTNGHLLASMAHPLRHGPVGSPGPWGNQIG